MYLTDNKFLFCLMIFGAIGWSVGCGARQERGWPRGEVRFEEVAERTGLRFRHRADATAEFRLPEIMGAGVALLDWDNDGDLDVFVVQGGALERPAAFEPGCFRNLVAETGQLRFEDVSRGCVTAEPLYGMGLAAGDYDGDGRVDLFVTGVGRAALLRNVAAGRFKEALDSGVVNAFWGASAAWLDYDRDGDLDLYVTNYLDFSARAAKTCYAPTGERDYCSPSVYNGVPDRLFRNEGQGRFTDVSAQAGIGTVAGPGLGVVTWDPEGDGWPDLYVANDGKPNLLWRNRRDGTFEEIALETGVAVNQDGAAQAGMGVDAADLLHDGEEALVVTNMRNEWHNLFLRPKGGFYEDAGPRMGVSPMSNPRTGFGVRFADLDNDGWLDLFVANGAVTLRPDQRGEPYPFRETNQVLWNRRGVRFEDVSSTAGPAFGIKGVGRGLAVGDLDHDGRVDVVVSENNGPLRVYLNQSGEQPWLRVELVDAQGRRNPVGTVVQWRPETGMVQSRRVHPEGSYLSSSDPRLYFGLGADVKRGVLRVKWLSGRVEEWGVEVWNRVVQIKEGAGRSVTPRE